MTKRITFLTKKNFDKKQIIQKVEEYLGNILDENEQNIIKNILKDFKNDNFSLIDSQEVQFLNLHDYDKWVPYLIFRYKFIHFPKEQKLNPNFPLYLLVEPVSSCNLRCTMCMQVDESFSKNQKFMGMMDMKLFKKIIDEAEGGGIKALTFASRGEPTLHPHIGEMLEYCSGKFLEFKMNTNATKLSEKLSHKILKSELTDIVFSIDSYTKGNYEKIRVGGIFEQVLENIKNFLKIKNEQYPNSKLSTRISGVKVDQNMDPTKFKEFWEPHVDNVGLVELANWDTYNNTTDMAGHDPCNYLWERMYVWFDGLCNPCDTDYKSELALGSLKEKTIKEIWNGEKFKRLRELHTDEKRSSCYPCDRCPEW
jgi:radical SAM protein with 4Fe4S-binding SPASM domain